MNDMMLGEANEKGRLLSQAIAIIEKLSNNDFADSDFDMEESENISEIKRLIVRSRALTSDRWWKNLK